MNPDIRQIRAFVAVAQLGSFTGRQLPELSQPALTVQIRNPKRLWGAAVRP